MLFTPKLDVTCTIDASDDEEAPRSSTSSLILFARGYTADTPLTIYILRMRSRVYLHRLAF